MNVNSHTPNRFSIAAAPLAIATLILVVAVAAFFLWRSVKPATPEVPTPDYWPTMGWRTAPLEAHGFDSPTTAHGLRAIRKDGIRIHSLLVVRSGEVILDAYFYPYDGSTIHDVASVTKSVTTTLIAIAAEQGKLDLDAPMLSFFPDREIANLDARKERVTVRHLASMSSGLECYHHPNEPTNRAMQASGDWVQFALDLPMAYEPGTHFTYCSPGMHLLSAILKQATGMSALEFARLNLFQPLGIQESDWSADPQGINNGGGDLFLYPRDMAKIGFLWLHGGEWEGKQIVSREWVRLSSQRQIETGENYGEDYGYGWWIARPGENPTFAADGRGGQKIIVFPAMDLVLVSTGGGFEWDDAGKYLERAVGESDPLPGNPEGVADLQAALSEILLPPAAKPVPALPETAGRISSNIYHFDENFYTLESLRLAFNQANTGSDQPVEATLHVSFHDNKDDWSCAVGLDGQYRFTQVTDEQGRKFILGMRGAWIDAQTFVLEQNEIASPNVMEIRIQFDGNRVLFEGPGLDGAGTISLEGWQE